MSSSFQLYLNVSVVVPANATSVEVPRELRIEVWNRIADDLKAGHIDLIANREVGFDELPDCFPAYIDGQVTGRTIVRLS